MSDAKKCDNCGDLYEPVSNTHVDDYHNVSIRYNVGGFSHPDINAKISLYTHWDPKVIDDCRPCVVLAVRKFMAKFSIPERKGESFIGTMVDENEPAFSDFVSQFDGKRVRITVEVL